MKKVPWHESVLVERFAPLAIGVASLLTIYLLRASIASHYAAEKLTDEARRRIERELDLEDARIRHAADSAAGRLHGFGEV